MFQRRLQYLVKWEGYGVEGNSWEYADNVENAPEKVAEFHVKNPAAPRRIRAMAFGMMPFRKITVSTAASSRCLSEGGVIVRGTPSRRPPPQFSPATVPTTSASADASAASLLYVPPHRRPPPRPTPWPPYPPQTSL